jgi:HPt (histidine-containing phosphotransfer) domain-containing protein
MGCGADHASAKVPTIPATYQMSAMVHDAHPATASAPATATLDVEGAIALLGDNPALYLQIAEAFCAELATLPLQLDALRHPGTDLAAAKRVLHTFKGLSLTVGALALSEACRQAEGRLKDAQDPGELPDATTLATLRHQLTTAADATLQALVPVLERLKPASTATAEQTLHAQAALDPPRLVDDLRALKHLLDASDMRAIDLHADIQRRHATANHQLGGLQAAVLSFDFAQGVVQCQALIRTLSDNN